MKQKSKLLLLLTVVLVVSVICLAACKTGNDVLDGKYIVKFKFNGGSLTMSTSSVDDSSSYGYAYEQKGVLILDPVAFYSKEGTTDAIRRSGYNFTGWYKDEACTQRWDFAKDKLEQDELTLYAGWEKQINFTFTVYYMDGDTPVAVNSYAPSQEQINAGAKISRNNRERTAKRAGYTPMGYYSDPACTMPWNDDFVHPADEQHPDVPIYVKYLEGEWNLVSNYNELYSAYRSNKNIYLLNDIDCEGDILYINTYGGTWQGNNHTVSNFVVENNSIGAISMFGTLRDNAALQNIKFADVTYRIKSNAVSRIQISVIAQTCGAAKIDNVSIGGVVENLAKDISLDNLVGNNIVIVYNGQENAEISAFTCNLTIKATEE